MSVLGRPTRHTGTVALAALALCLSACAGPVAAPGATPPTDPTAAANPAPPVDPALSFSGPTVDGGTFDAATLAGMPVVLWFWAPF